MTAVRASVDPAETPNSDRGLPTWRRLTAAVGASAILILTACGGHNGLTKPKAQARAHHVAQRLARQQGRICHRRVRVAAVTCHQAP